MEKKVENKEFQKVTLEVPKDPQRPTWNWKYEIKSVLRTFFATFIIFLIPLLDGVDFTSVKNALEAGGIVAAARSIIVVLIEPVAKASWNALKVLLKSLKK